MAKVYRIEQDGQWVEDKRLRACGPFIFEVSEIANLFPEWEELTEELSADGRGIMRVPRGLGMGWPELKDLGVTVDFADESEKIKLSEGTNL